MLIMYLTGHMMDGYIAICMDNQIYETVAHFGKQYALIYETITHFGFKVYTVTYDQHVHWAIQWSHRSCMYTCIKILAVTGVCGCVL